MAQVRIPSDRSPTPPGEMLLEEFIKPLGMTQAELADRIGVSYVRLNEIVNGRRGITPSTALRLAKALGTTPPVLAQRPARTGSVPGITRRRRTAAASPHRPGLAVNSALPNTWERQAAWSQFWSQSPLQIARVRMTSAIERARKLPGQRP